MSAVELADDYLPETGKDLPGVAGERVDVIEVHTAYFPALCTQFLRSRKDMAERTAPTSQEDVSAVGTVYHQVRDVGDYPCHFLGPLLYHEGMVFGIRGKHSGVVLLKTADAVLKSGGSGGRPLPGEGFSVPLERLEFVPVRLGQPRLDGREIIHRRNLPGL